MIYVSEHAILRYQERVKPTHNFPRAKHELEVLVRMAGGPCGGLPEWYKQGDCPICDSWLELSDGIAGLVSEGVVTTIVARGGASPGERERKNKRKASKRAARRLKNRSWHQKREYDRRQDAAWR